MGLMVSLEWDFHMLNFRYSVFGGIRYLNMGLRVLLSEVNDMSKWVRVGLAGVNIYSWVKIGIE